MTAVRNDPNQSSPTTAFSKVTPADLGINITPDHGNRTAPPLSLMALVSPPGSVPDGPTTFANTVYSYYDNLTWTKGRHNMKFGVFFSPYQNNTQV